MGLSEQGAARRLLSERDSAGRIQRHPYDKWRGAHWVLAVLADIGYPAGDEGLIPLREQVLEWLLRRRPVATRGRVRVCCSLEGNGVWSLLKLGLADERVDPTGGADAGVAVAGRRLELRSEGVREHLVLYGDG